RMMNPVPFSVKKKSGYFSIVYLDLDLVEQQQHEKHHQNDTAQSHSGMAHAVAIAAEPAAEAAQQINDHDNDQDQTQRHGTLLRPAAGQLGTPIRTRLGRKAQSRAWFHAGTMQR